MKKIFLSLLFGILLLNCSNEISRQNKTNSSTETFKIECSLNIKDYYTQNYKIYATYDNSTGYFKVKTYLGYVNANKFMLSQYSDFRDADWKDIKEFPEEILLTNDNKDLTEDLLITLYVKVKNNQNEQELDYKSIYIAPHPEHINANIEFIDKPIGQDLHKFTFNFQKCLNFSKVKVKINGIEYIINPVFDNPDIFERYFLESEISNSYELFFKNSDNQVIDFTGYM
jgi:hypothetical protein